MDNLPKIPNTRQARGTLRVPPASRRPLPIMCLRRFNWLALRAPVHEPQRSKLLASPIHLLRLRLAGGKGATLSRCSRGTGTGTQCFYKRLAGNNSFSPRTSSELKQLFDWVLIEKPFQLDKPKGASDEIAPNPREVRALSARRASGHPSPSLS